MNTKPNLTLVCPSYNEQAIIIESLNVIYNYMKENLSPKYTWEILVINDGSKDNTGKLAEEFASNHENIRVVHHYVNMNLGVAIKTGFANAIGEFIIIYDLDLSYSPDHIKSLLDSIIEQQADIVVASPYMKGGKTTDVPFNRRMMSKMANRYLSIASRKKLCTFSGMVRAYKASFVKSLSLKATTFEINTEIIFKAQILRARIIEIPAHLDWSFQNKFKTKRFSGIKLKSGIFDGIVSGFIFRPYMFFIIPGLILLLISIYVIGWILINIYHVYPSITIDNNFFDERFSKAVAILFQKRPHAFFVGGFTLVVALQFLGIGFLSFQNKRYFDEMFFLGTKQLEEISKANIENLDNAK
jgi:glycosyltransferase involved in cell wall biosynthesis